MCYLRFMKLSIKLLNGKLELKLSISFRLIKKIKKLL